MLPDAIWLRNYRAFMGEHRFEVRPVTLFYGDNNAGKSVLLRTLPVLCDAVSSDKPGALDLESPALYRCGFSDLAWKGSYDDDVNPDLGVGFEWSEGHRVRSVRYTLDRKQRRVQIVAATLECDGQTHEFKWVPLPGDEVRGQTFDHRCGGPAERHEIEFQGLVPQPPSSGALAKILEPLTRQLQGFAHSVQWLEAKRHAPARRIPSPAGPRWRMAPDGRDAPQVLYSLPELGRRVSRWYRDAIGRSLDCVDAPPDEFRLVLRSVGQAMEVDMPDSGQGTIQVLPVLVALALLGTERGPRLLAVEEPESHLHGSSQIALTREICRTASEAKDVRIAIETHSRHVLLGVQLALLEGALRPEDVVIYWVRQDERGRSEMDRVTLDQDAYLQGVWPDPFDHMRDAARRVIRAREDKKAT